MSHLVVHLPYYPFKCQLCSAKFKRKYDYRKHRLSVHKMEENTNNLNRVTRRATASIQSQMTTKPDEYKANIDYILNSE